MDFETKYTPGWTLLDQATTLESDFESVTSSIPTKIQTKPSKIDRIRPFNNNTQKDQDINISHGFSDTSDQGYWNKMTFKQYEEEYDRYFDNIDHDTKVIPIPPGMFDTFDTDDKFIATITTTTTNIESPTTTADTTNTHSITDTPIDIPTANIPPIASSPTETKIRPEFNEVNATTTTTTTTEEEEEVCTIIDHKFYTMCNRTNKASNTTMTVTISEDKFMTSTTTDIPNIMENTTTVHTTDNVPTTHTTTDHAFSESTVRTTNTINAN